MELNCILDHVAEHLSCCCGGSKVDKCKDGSMYTFSIIGIHFSHKSVNLKD